MVHSTPMRFSSLRGALILLTHALLLLGTLSFAAGAGAPTQNSGTITGRVIEEDGGEGPLVNYDIQGKSRGTTLPSLPGIDPAKALEGLPKGTHVKFSALTRRASRVDHSTGALTDPSPAQPVQIAQKFLAEHPVLFGLAPAETQSLAVTRNYTTPGLDVTHLTLAQQFRGIPVFRSQVVVNVDFDGRLLQVGGELVPNLPGSVNAVAPQISAPEALALAARYGGMNAAALPAPQGAPVGPRMKVTFPAGAEFFRPVTVELTYYQTAPGQVSLAWDTTLFQNGSTDIYHILVDATDGRLLFRSNYTQYAPQGLVYHRDSPQDGTPYLGGVPPVLERVTRPFNGGATFPPGDPHFDWWAGASPTTTETNNVRAGENRDGPSINSGFLALFPNQVSAPGQDFSFPLDLSQQPHFWTDAAVVNLFYWNNVCHDVWYRYGFTEAAGNFQRLNFGLGGLGDDQVIALGQACADCTPPDRDNAFFATLPDGTPSFMAMFEFETTSPRRDSDLDNGVIIHEFGHGLSNRLIGNGNGLFAFQSGSMGEGWSDFCALMLLAEPTDDIHAPYPQGGWILNDFVNGIRSAPYSSNPAVFTKTYNDIQIPFPEVHFAGEIMCNTLWQMYVRFVTRLGFTEGRDRAMQLLIDAFKLCPSDPTYLDFRDALVRAEHLRYRCDNLADIWQVFAAHGMGFSAATVGPDDFDPTEAFDIPTDIYSAGGKVTNSANQPMAGVTVNIAGRIAVTAADGTYEVTGLPAGIHTAIPSFNFFGFTPATTEVAVPPCRDGVNFVGQVVAEPPGPINLTAAAISPRQIRLTWVDTNNGESVFEILRKTDSTAYALLAAVGPNSTMYVDSNVVPNTRYTYKLRAILSYAPTTYTNEASATTLPEGPTALTARVASATQINVEWVPGGGGQDGFRLDRVRGASFQSGADLTTITVAADQTTYADMGLASNTTYTYRIVAFNGGGNSTISREAGGTTLRDRPASPTNLVVSTLSATSLGVSWIDGSDNESGFVLERSSDGGTTWPVTRTVDAAGGTGTTVSTTETGLASNTEYTYRVKAVNGNNGSDYVGPASRLTLPAAPTGLTAVTVSSGEIQLAWTDGSSKPSAFSVERRTSDGDFGVLTAVASGMTAHSDTTVAPGTTYTYRVRATNAEGASAYSDTATASTLQAPPATPVGLEAMVLSNREIRLAWQDASTNEAQFRIERKLVGGAADFRQIATLNAVAGDGSQVTFTDTQLTPGTAYAYRVRTSNNGGNSPYTDIVEATTLPNAPGVPSGLKVTAVSQSVLRLDWLDGSSNETGFRIEQSLDGQNFSQIHLTLANVVTYDREGLQADTRYYFRVRATNTGGDSSFSNIASALTLPEKPNAPGGLNATATSPTSIRLQWNDLSSNETAFRIERSLNGVDFAPRVTVVAGTTTYTDQQVDPSTTYHYRAIAVNTGGESDPSNVAMATTPAVPPSAPTALTVTVVSQSELRLAWTDTSGTETGFEVERRSGDAGFGPLITKAANSTSHTDSGLVSNTEYVYRVRAVNDGGVSAFTPGVGKLTLPAAPSGLAAMASAQQRVTLTWTDNSARPSAFKVERAPGGTGNWTQIAVTPIGATEYADNSLAVDTSFSYRVRATNASGDSGYSETVGTRTLPVPPSAPTNLRVAGRTQVSVQIAWNDASNNELGFQVERSDNGGASFSQIAVLGVGSDTYNATGLSPATSYRFRVRSYNSGGESDFASTVTAETLPNPPSAPTNLTVTIAPGEQTSPGATMPGASSLVLAWNDTSSDETGFRIERSTNGGESFSPVTIVPPGQTAFTDGGLTPNTSYTYRVRAVNTGGDSSPSNTATRATLPTPPAAPTGLALTALTAGSIKIDWTDQSSNETGFRVERRSGDGDFLLIHTAGAGATSYTDPAVSPSATYTYRVAAVNTGGLSAYVQQNTTLPVGLASLTLNLTSVRGGKPVRGRVTLSGPAPAGGAVITLESDSVAGRVPAKVKIPARKTTATFVLRTVRPATSVNVRVTGAYGGVTRGASISVVR